MGPMPEAGPERLVVATGEGLARGPRATAGGPQPHDGLRVPARRRTQSAGAVSTPADTPGAAQPGQVGPAREAAFAALRRLRSSGTRLDESAAALPEISSLSPADRGLANELVNGTVKRRASVDAVLGAYTKAPLKDADPDVRDALRMTAFQLLFLDRVPGLRGRGRRRDAGVQTEPPHPRLRQCRAAQGGLGRAARSSRSSAPATARTRGRSVCRTRGGWSSCCARSSATRAPLRCSRPPTARRSAACAPTGCAAGWRRPSACSPAEGFKIKGVEGLPDGLLYDGPPLERSEAFAGGLVTPQSRGSQVAGLVAAGAVTGPGARVLDVCAAPGAKTSQMASLLPRRT